MSPSGKGAVAPSFTFAVLGGVEVWRDGEPVRLEGERARALLSFMLARANRTLSADELIDALWGDRELRDPHNVLQACVSRLRRVVGSETLPRTANGYQLVVGPGELDAGEFERLVAEGESALEADDAQRAAITYQRALRLWRGDAYADLAYSGVLDDEIRRLQELRTIAVERRIDALLRLGEGAGLIPELEALVNANPYRERLRSQLAVALYRAGRQVDALDVCRAARRMLLDDLGLEPGVELREIELAILRQDETLDHRPPQRAPVPPTPLIGREREVAEASALLRRKDVRVLTIRGPGGIGKTRLALALAAELDDAMFVDLSGVRDHSLVASSMATAAGLRHWQGQPVVDALEHYLRGRETVFVLDNFEHLIDAAPLLARLVSHAPHIAFLVTSRRALRIAPEHELVLGPLAEEAGVGLFRARARALDPAYVTSESEESAVAEICRRLEGNPLAIELAAARSNVISPQLLSERLRDGFDALSAAGRDASERHQTLDAAIEWGFELLEDDERLALAQLAVFAGGFTLEAADAVLGHSSLNHIAALADASLVQPERDDRFQLLDTIRQYALEKLSTHDPEAVSSRHAEYYTELVEAALAEMTGPTEPQAFRRVELEHRNVYEAFAFALDAGRSDLVVRLAVASRRFWYLHGHLEKGLENLEAALGVAPAEDLGLQAVLHNNVGIFAAEQGAYEKAADAFGRCAELHRESGDQLGLSCVLVNLSRLAAFDSEPDRARDLLEEALRLDPEGAERSAISYANLSLCAVDQGDLDGALSLAEKGCSIARRQESARMISDATLALGRVLVERGELERALTALRECLAAKLEIAERPGLAECLEAIAEPCAVGHDPDVAAMLYGCAESIRASVGAARLPDTEARYVRYSSLARSLMGDHAYEGAFEDGRRLPLPDAVEKARAAVAVGDHAVSAAG